MDQLLSHVFVLGKWKRQVGDAIRLEIRGTSGEGLFRSQVLYPTELRARGIEILT